MDSKEEDEEQVLRALQKINDNKMMKIIFIVLIISWNACIGYANISIQFQKQYNAQQLMIVTLQQLAIQYEARQFLNKTDIRLSSIGIFLSTLISINFQKTQEIFFSFIAIAVFLIVSCSTINQEQILDKSLESREGEVIVSETDSRAGNHNQNLVQGTALLSQQNNYEQKAGRIILTSIPISRSIRMSSRIPIHSDHQFQLAHVKRQLTSNKSSYRIQSGITMVPDRKLSRILSIPHHYFPSMSSEAQDYNEAQSFTESLSNYLQFYKGMVEKLDSAIFVIGGPNKVYEPLNSKAENFFASHIEAEGGENGSYDFSEIFAKIIVKDYNKSCFSYLSTIGISKIQFQTQELDLEKHVQKQGTLNNYFTSGFQAMNQKKKQSSVSILSPPPKMQNQNSKKNNLKNFLGLKTLQTTYEVDQSKENNEAGDCLKINSGNEENIEIDQNYKRSSSQMIFPKMTLLNLIQKIVDSKEAVTDTESIEVIQFECSEELRPILQYAQIKLYAYVLNGEQFLFLLFQNNKEREEIIRETIHKDIVFQTFKTISHELGTYANFILQILEGASSDSSIPKEIKKEYFENLQNNANLLNCIIQDIRDYNSHLNNDLRIKITSTIIKPLIIRTSKMFQQIANMKQIEFEVLIDSEVPNKVFTDKMKIQQILIHLIQNSLKFSQKGCSIHLSVQYDKETHFVCFSVCDNGIGMDEKEVDRLNSLLRNSSLAEKVSPNSSGFGFGLTISNILAKKILFQKDDERQLLHENEPGIHFVSEKGIGSKFCFYLNTMDGQNIVTQSLSNEVTLAQSIQKSRVSKIKINEYEYFEIDDDIQIQEKNDFMVNEGLECRNEDIVLDNGLQKSNQALYISQKLPNLLSPSIIFKNPENPKLTITDCVNQQITQDQNIQQNQLHPTAMGEEICRKRKQASTYIINTFVSKKSETIMDLETDEEIQAVVIPHISITQKKHIYYKILIADDEMMNIFGLRMILKALGIDANLILTAFNGKEALDVFQDCLQNKSKNYQIKLIFMDINMPVMGGIESTKRILTTHEQFKCQKGENTNSVIDTNIVACTSYDDYDTKLKCLQAGMISYLSKPCNKEGLQHILQKYYFN